MQFLDLGRRHSSIMQFNMALEWTVSGTARLWLMSAWRGTHRDPPLGLDSQPHL
jgi:hypothetical protein